MNPFEELHLVCMVIHVWHSSIVFVAGPPGLQFIGTETGRNSPRPVVSAKQLAIRFSTELVLVYIICSRQLFLVNDVNYNVTTLNDPLIRDFVWFDYETWHWYPKPGSGLMIAEIELEGAIASFNKELWQQKCYRHISAVPFSTMEI